MEFATATVRLPRLQWPRGFSARDLQTHRWFRRRAEGVSKRDGGGGLCTGDDYSSGSDGDDKLDDAFGDGGPFPDDGTLEGWWSDGQDGAVEWGSNWWVVPDVRDDDDMA